MIIIPILPKRLTPISSGTRTSKLKSAAVFYPVMVVVSGQRDSEIVDR